MGLNDLTDESILSSTWLSSIASSQMRGTSQNTQLDNVPILTTYEHYDLLLRMIDRASQIEEAERDLPHILELLAIKTYYLPCRQWKVPKLRRRLVSPSEYLPERIPYWPSISHLTGSEAR
jgi:hypothetical protein